MPFKNVPAKPIHERFKDHMVHCMQGWLKQHPDITNEEVIAVMGRIAGYAVALMPLEERDLARKGALKNFEEGIKWLEVLNARCND